MNLNQLTTEQRNEKTMNLDQMTPQEILTIMNQEDQQVLQAVKQNLPQIEAAVHLIVESFNQQGRLIYLGAGTSGRLGVLDAAECVPTFGVDPSMVIGLIAGGDSAMTVAVEGAEDSKDLAQKDLTELQLTSKDTVVGLAASGRTPYSIGGLDYANQIGAHTVSISCNQQAELSNHADVAIELQVGPEILSGSTRLKSGTAQKIVLNMLSTVSMIGIGKVFKNLMVDVQATNEKLIERSKRIIMEATDCNYETASTYYDLAKKDVKLAIVMILTDLPIDQAKLSIKQANGFVRQAITDTTIQE